MSRCYTVVDVFSDKPLFGNPVAVLLDAEGLDSADMQAVARWTNLSETTFVLPAKAAGADYRLRIFTPKGELPFAGHPTLGSAHAALEAGRIKSHSGRVIQECGSGLVSIRVEALKDGLSRLALELPAANITDLPAEDIVELESIIGQAVLREAPPAVVDVGPVWLIAQLPDVQSLISLTPDYNRSAVFERRLGLTGLTLFALREGEGPELEVRSFAPSNGVNEDPVCGSGNGSIAVFQLDRGLVPAGGISYEVSQGRCVGRDGRVFVSINSGGKVQISGACVTSVSGKLEL